METAPFFEDIADGPPGGAAHWVRASDGVRLRLTHWTKPKAKGTILLFTGRTEFAEKYGRPARLFGDAGYAVLVNDWRGQGLSDRLYTDPRMGHVGKFADYQRDVAAIVAHADALDLPKPYFLLAHSLGGGIGLRALMEGLPVNAAAFSAPMFGIAATPFKRRAVMVLAAMADVFGQSGRVVPGLSTANTIAQTPFGINALTSDRAEYAFLQEQVKQHPELGLGAPSLHWVQQAVKETDRMARLPSPNVPTLTMLGSKETIVSSDRIHDRMRRWPLGELIVVDGGKHEMMMETPEIKTQMMTSLISHFDGHL